MPQLIPVYLESDDDTYVSGNMYAFSGEQGEPIEPYYYHCNNTMVKCYPSRHIYLEYESTILIKIVYTLTCWSDDISIYYIDDWKIWKSFHTHGHKSTTYYDVYDLQDLQCGPEIIFKYENICLQG